MSDIEAVLARIAVRRPKLIDLSLERMHAVLARLGAPHLQLPPTIHVAGTNGKGSVVAYMRAILEASGKTAHVYISPHLVRFNERITLAGRPIEDAALIAALEACDAAAGADRLTYFETVTCAAFAVFAETPADILLLEVGLGGRLDATNVIEKPAASVVAPVGLDHEQFLGDTIESVAQEKAGIFRRGAPAVVGKQSPAAMATLEMCAMKTGAPFFGYGQHWHAQAENGRLIYQDDDGLRDFGPPRLAGAHQFDNAGLAVAALKQAGFLPSDDLVTQGLAAASWPARLQRLTAGPLTQMIRAHGDPSTELWLDGGHNPHAGAAIAQTMADMEERRPKPLILICGMQKNKNMKGFLAPFAGLARSLFAVAADHDGAAPPGDVAAAAAAVGLAATASSDLPSAVSAALQKAGAAETAPRILICGSLYLAGEVLRDHE